MISELDRFLSGPKGPRRATLLVRRLDREAQRYRQALNVPHTPEQYQTLQRLYGAIEAARTLLEKALSRQEIP